MALELRKRVVEFLSANPDKRFKAREIASWICDTFPLEAAAKLAANPALLSPNELLNQLVAEIGANRPNWQEQHPQMRTTEGARPRLYYWTTKSDEDEVKEADQVGKRLTENSEDRKLRERDLYPFLMGFLSAEYGLQCFRIDDRKSSNSAGSGGNKWLFPDVVAIENLTIGLDTEVVGVMRESSNRRVRLWSFEVKLLLNKSNVRESYFLALSNSSWANLGYLVAADIQGADTMKELRTLYEMHGIGLIKLDAENPVESQMLIPARERSDLAWAMCSRLATENRDFRDFTKKIRQFFQTGDL